MSSPLKIITQRWKVIFLSGLALGLFAVLLSIFLPLEYRADTQLIIIARQQYGVDPFTISKSAERMADNLAQAIETDAFFDEVIADPNLSEIQKSYSQLDARERREAWQMAVEGSTVFGTNLMNVSAFAKDSNDAQVLATAVAETIVKSGSNFVGSTIEARVVNQPIATRFPVRPNLVLNFLLGFVVGALGMGFVVARKFRHSWV